MRQLLTRIWLPRLFRALQIAAPALAVVTGSMSAGEPLLLRPEEVAEKLGCGRSAVFDLLRKGELRSVKLGRSRRIPVDALQEFVERLVADSEDDVG